LYLSEWKKCWIRLQIDFGGSYPIVIERNYPLRITGSSTGKK
jgi:hypothetical protein